MWTLQNCLVYPLLAATAGLGKLVEEPPGTLEKYGIIRNSSWAEAIMNEITAMTLFPIVAGCLQQYGDASGFYDSIDWLSVEYPSWSNGTMAAVYPTPYVEWIADINQDVGGPGVATSLLVQSCILLAAWLFIDLNTGWLQTFLQFLRVVPNNTDTGWRVLRFPTQRAAVITALVDFQKTQVFFALTLQIAFLLTFGNNDLLQAGSWSDLRTNLEEVPILAAPGVAAVALNLLILRKDTQELAWYILGISSICVVISAITGFLATSIVPSPTQPQDPNIALHICGLYSPWYTAWAAPPIPQTQIQGIFAADIIMPIPILVMICILMEKVSRTPSLERKLQLRRRIQLLHQCMPGRAQAASVAIGNIGYFSVEMWLLFCSVAVGIHEFHETNALEPKWTLGQIIAVAIWIPIFVNWCYAALAGVEKAFKHVLSRDYRVIKKDSTASNSHIVDLDQDAGVDDSGQSLRIQSAASGHEMQALGHESSSRQRLLPVNTI